LHSDSTLARSSLAALLWGENDDAAARHSLSQALTTLRKFLNDSGQVVATKHAVLLRGSALEVDALEFLRLTEQSSVDALESAVTLYRGEFLEDLITGEEAFEDWLQKQRQKFRKALQDGYRGLLERYEREGRHQRALDCCLRLLAQDPYNESVLRKLMLLHLEQGRGLDALDAFRGFAERLQRDLDVEPDHNTKEIYLRILQGRGVQLQTSKETRQYSSGLIEAFRSLDGFALWDEQDRFVLSNENYREILEPAADILKPGAPWLDVVRRCAEAGRFPEARGGVEAWLRETQRRRKAGVTDAPDLALDDGRIFRLAHWKTETGGTAVVLTDVTSRKQEEIDLFRAKVRFRALAEIGSLALLEFDPAGRVVFSNATLHRMLGYEPGQLVGRDIEDVITSPRPFLRHAPGSYDLLSRTQLRAQLADRTGGAVDVLLEVSSYPDETGRIAGFIAVVTQP
jgi:PAS domain S-box-containing protein